RTLIVFSIGLLTFSALVYLAGVKSPELMISENITMFGLAVAAIFMVYTGHAVLSSIFVFLVKLNKGVELKISWHLSVLFLAYLGLLIFLRLIITGHAMPDIGSTPILIMLLISGIFGYFETKRKIRQINQPYPYPWVGEGLYLIGFAITVFVYWNAEVSVNRPM